MRTAMAIRCTGLACAILLGVVHAHGADQRAFQEGMRFLREGQFEEGAQRLLEGARTDAEQGDFAGAYWKVWQLARLRATPWDVTHRIAWYELAASYLKQVDHTDAKWRGIHLPNYVQLLCEKETLQGTLGCFGLGHATWSAAEAAMAEALGSDEPVEERLRRMRPMVRGVYLNLLMDRADYQKRSGELHEAAATFDEAIRIQEEEKDEQARNSQHCRILNNLAVLLKLLGHDDAAERYAQKAVALRVVGHAGDAAEVSLLRDRSQREGPSEEIVQKMLEKSARFRSRKNERYALDTERRVASVLYELGETNQAEALCAQVIAGAIEHGFRAIVAQSYFWRGKARTRQGLPGAEVDFLAALDFYRQEVSKPHEFSLYKAYGDLLIRENRLQEAIPVLDEALRLNAMMEAPCLRPEALALKADALARLGHTEAADELWDEALRLIASVAELSAGRRLDIQVARLKYLALTGRADELQAYYDQVLQATVEGALTTYQKRSFAAFELDQAQPALPLAAELPPVDLQPVYVSTRTLAGAEARATLWLLNAAAIPRQGTLAVSADSGVELLRACNGDIQVTLAGVETSVLQRAHTNVTLDASTTAAVRLQHGSPPLEAPTTVSLTWTCGGTQTARWDVVGGAEVFESTANVSASLLWTNPFYSIPLYHEIWSPVVDATGLLDFRVRASAHCRLEVYRSSDGALYALDADGNGSYADAGDFVAVDDDLNSIPDTQGPLSVMILVFPAPGCTYEAPLDVTVETAIEGHWRTIGTDRILPRP